jgi:hypothetical protein
MSTEEDIRERSSLKPVVEWNGPNLYTEQISCHAHSCVRINYDSIEELDDLISESMKENTGRFLIELKTNEYKLSSDELAPVVNYLKEINKRDGRVSIEPLYIGTRGPEGLSFGVFKDTLFLGYDIYSRIKNLIKYRNTGNYNSKVVYDPKTNAVKLIFFVHKSYGDVCASVFSNCKVVEYIDDETFDLSLSNALRDTEKTNENIKISFRNTQAILPIATIEVDTLKEINSSVRLYKWFVAAKKTEKKPLIRQRMVGVEAIITLLDYSIKAYDAIQSYKIYKTAFHLNVEIMYTGAEKGGKIESVVFKRE